MHRKENKEWFKHAEQALKRLQQMSPYQKRMNWEAHEGPSDIIKLGPIIPSRKNYEQMKKWGFIATRIYCCESQRQQQSGAVNELGNFFEDSYNIWHGNPRF
jgi:hypothetical protein